MRQAWLVIVVFLAIIIGTATAAEKSKMVQGKVTAIAADTVTIAHGTGTMVFVVDGKTLIRGKGLTTKSNELAAKGQKLTLTDAVGVGDNVSVTYTEKEGKLIASEVKITQKSLMPAPKT